MSSTRVGPQAPSPPARDGDDSLTERFVTILPAALAGLTATLGAIGGLTGGIARMLRNAPIIALLVMGAAVVAALVAVAAKLAAPESSRRRALLAISILMFTGSLLGGLYLAVETTSKKDRPSLSADLVQAPDGDWAVKGTATASGLAADGQLHLYIYAYFSNPDDSGYISLLQSTVGPNAEGIASSTYNIPVPSDRTFESFVISASVQSMRFCNGKPVEVDARLRQIRFSRADEKADAGASACLSFALPPKQESPQARGGENR